MEIKNEFEVPASIDQVWDLLLDVERVVPCVPGAELTDVVEEGTWKGKMAIKLGPIRLSFAGEVHLEETDEAARRVEMQAKGQETRGKGNAQANVTSVLTSVEDGTMVSIATDLKLSGPVAQYGRGMIQDVSSRMVDQFAGCLASQFQEAPTNEGQAAPHGQTTATGGRVPAAEAQKPVKGLSLILGALWRSVLRFVKRLFGGRPQER